MLFNYLLPSLYFKAKFHFLSLFAYFPVELLARLGVAALSTEEGPCVKEFMVMTKVNDLV